MSSQDDAKADSSGLAQVLSELSNEAFYDLIDSRTNNPEVLERLVEEEAYRGELGADELEELFESFLTHSLRQLTETYVQLCELYSFESTDASIEFAKTVESYVAGMRRTEPDWPWPPTEPPGGPNTGVEITIEHTESGLTLCGYHVGKTKGLSQRKRRQILDDFFRNPLQSKVTLVHGSAYGEPGSETRLQKMANVIAANCRNRKKSDREKYRVAIGHWDSDLAYLKDSYYRAGSFPWPRNEP